MANDKRFIRDAFADIAPRYDRLNTMLSFGVERYWRRRATSRLAPCPGEQILDLCAGTLTLSRAIRRRAGPGGVVASLDFCMEMLELGRSRLDTEEKAAIPPVCGDAECLPFGAGAFDAAFAAYGIRNLPDPPSCFREVHRVLKPGGRFVILDFLRPANPAAAALYGFYLHRVLPILGGALSGSFSAYRHLADSIEAFTDRAVLSSQLEQKLEIRDDLLHRSGIDEAGTGTGRADLLEESPTLGKVI